MRLYKVMVPVTVPDGTTPNIPARVVDIQGTRLAAYRVAEKIPGAFVEDIYIESDSLSE